MDYRTSVAVLVVGPPDDPTNCIAHDSTNGTQLPKKIVDSPETNMRGVAKDLVEDCPVVNEWEFTMCSDQYSYRYGGCPVVEETVHVFLIGATRAQSEQNAYRWIPLSNYASEFSHGLDTLKGLKQSLLRGLTVIGVDVAFLTGDRERSPKERAEKADQDTTLTDFENRCLE